MPSGDAKGRSNQAARLRPWWRCERDGTAPLSNRSEEDFDESSMRLVRAADGKGGRVMVVGRLRAMGALPINGLPEPALMGVGANTVG